MTYTEQTLHLMLDKSRPSHNLASQSTSQEPLLACEWIQTLFSFSLPAHPQFFFGGGGGRVVKIRVTPSSYYEKETIKLLTPQQIDEPLINFKKISSMHYLV